MVAVHYLVMDNVKTYRNVAPCATVLRVPNLILGSYSKVDMADLKNRELRDLLPKASNDNRVLTLIECKPEVPHISNLGHSK